MKDPYRQALEISRRSGPHVEDVRRLLAFHGIEYGAPDSLATIRAKLADNNAFRADLAALARHISALEHRTVTEDEMHTLMESAAGGKPLAEESSDSRVPAHEANPGTLLAGTGAWTEGHASNFISAEVVGSSAETRVLPMPQETSSSPARNSTPQPASGAAADRSADPTPPETGGSQGGLELAIAELKVYLDDIDRRIGRLEPRLEDITRIIQNSADRLHQSHDAEEPASPEPPLVDRQQLSTHPQTRTAPLHLREEPDLLHRGAPLPPAPLLKADAPPEPTSSPVPDPPPPVEPIRLGGTTQLRTWEHMTAPIDHGRSSSSTRQTVGRFLGVAAVLLAIAGGIAALYAFGNPGENATTAQTGSNQGRNPRVDERRSAPDATEATAPQTISASAAPMIRSESRSGRNREPDSPIAPPKTTLPQPTSPTLTSKPVISTTPAAKVAGKRSEPTRQEPRIEVPTTQAPSRRATDSDTPRTQSVVSRTEDGGIGKAAANNSPSGLVSRGGTPEVESHSSQAGLISSKTPVYPPEALTQHKEATVVLDALIARDGSVKRMDVVEGSPGFTRSALNAVSWWRYKPNRARGEAAETQARITVNYRIR